MRDNERLTSAKCSIHGSRCCEVFVSNREHQKARKRRLQRRMGKAECRRAQTEW